MPRPDPRAPKLGQQSLFDAEPTADKIGGQVTRGRHSEAIDRSIAAAYSKGYIEDVDEAADGTEALGKMKERRYGLVISDWNMEPMTGYELLKQVRSDSSLSKTPFIMVTAESKTENVIAAKKAGVNNYIVKPFNAPTLKSKIEAVFGD